MEKTKSNETDKEKELEFLVDSVNISRCQLESMRRVITNLSDLIGNLSLENIRLHRQILNNNTLVNQVMDMKLQKQSTTQNT